MTQMTSKKLGILKRLYYKIALVTTPFTAPLMVESKLSQTRSFVRIVSHVFPTDGTGPPSMGLHVLSKGTAVWEAPVTFIATDFLELLH